MYDSTKPSRAMFYHWVVGIALCVCGIGILSAHANESEFSTHGSSSEPSRTQTTLNVLLENVKIPSTGKPIPELSSRAKTQLEEAKTLAEQERFTEASIALERALRYQPNHPTIHRTLAILNYRSGNFIRAGNHANEALEEQPADVAAHYLLGLILERSAGTEASLEQLLRTAVILDAVQEPALAGRVYFALANALFDAGYSLAALEAYAKCQNAIGDEKADQASTSSDTIELPGPSTTQLQRVASERRATLLLKFNRHKEAVRSLAKLTVKFPQDLGYRKQYAIALAGAGKPNEALKALQDIKGNDDETIDLLISVYKELDRELELVVELRRRRDAGADSWPLIQRLADAELEAGQRSKAIATLNTYAQAHTPAPEALAKLVALYVADQEWKLAVQTASRTISASPSQAGRILKLLDARALSEAQTDALIADANALDPQKNGYTADTFVVGVLARQAERMEAARTLLEKSHKKAPTFLPTREALAQVYFDQFNYQAALDLAGRKVEAQPESAALELILGQAYERLDRWKEAEIHYRAAGTMDRQLIDARLGLARIYIERGDNNKSLQELRSIVTDSPANTEARELLADRYLTEGRSNEAILQYEQLQRVTTDPLVRVRCSALLDQATNTDPERFRETLREAMQEHGEDAATWLFLGGSYSAFQPDEAKAAFTNATRLEPANEKALIGLAQAQVSSLHFEEAIKTWDRLLAIRPNRQEWRLRLIRFHRLVLDHDKALTLTSAALADDTLNISDRRRYRVALIDILQKLNRDEEIANLIQSWRTEDDAVHYWARRLAQIHQETNEHGKAIEILEKVYEQGKFNAFFAELLASAYVQANKPDRALQLALDLIYEDPENDRYVAVLASVLEQTERVDDAIELAHNHMAAAFDRGGAQQLLLSILNRAERYKESAELLEEIIEEQARMGPRATLDITALRDLMASLLIADEKFFEAEQMLTRWIEETPSLQARFRFLTLLASSQDLQFATEAALATKQQALALQPNSIMMNNDIAYGWIDQGIRLDEAGPMIRFALGQSPDQPAYLDTYGWLLYKKGEFSDSVVWLERALGISAAPDPVILDHLGDAYWRLDKVNQARSAWEKSLAIFEERGQPAANSDEKRVLQVAKEKLEAIKSGEAPSTAPLGNPVQEDAGSENLNRPADDEENKPQENKIRRNAITYR